jgi:type II secretory pathway component GspD/PulD (secretin)
VGEKGGELVVIPPQTPEQNRVEETIQVEFHDVESATIRTRSLTTSSNEFYHILPNFPEDVLRKRLQQLLSTKYREVEIIDLKCHPADQQGILVIEKKLKIKDFAKRMGNAYGFNPLVDADTFQNHEVVALQERKTEIELEGPTNLIADITIRVPNSVAVEFVPKAKSFKNKNFGEYVYKIRHADGIIQVHRELRIHVKRISVKDYAEFRTFCRECIRQEEESVLLRKK